MRKFRMLFVTSLFLSVAIAPTIALSETVGKSETCIKTSDQEVMSLFDRWNSSLQTKNPDKVVENYAANAILLPTLSDMPRTNHAEMKDYFVMFLKSNPSGVVDKRVIRHGCDWATDTGVYTFTFNDEGKKEHVQARYSYAYEYIDGKWLIISHHSSLMPNSKDPKEDKKEMKELETGHDD